MMELTDGSVYVKNNPVVQPSHEYAFVMLISQANRRRTSDWLFVYLFVCLTGMVLFTLKSTKRNTME